jgi:4-hydroxybenzoyl-CoA reductase subunit alpha
VRSRPQRSPRSSPAKTSRAASGSSRGPPTNTRSPSRPRGSWATPSPRSRRSASAPPISPLRQIEVDYELLPSVKDLDEAESKTEAGLGASGRDNVSKRVDLAFGDVEAALAASDLVVEGSYTFEGTAHAPIEPHCALAQYDGDGLLTLWSTTQVPHYLHRELSRVLAVSPARIRVIQPPIGGAFGGKSEPFSLEFAAAKLAMMTGRPVKLLYTREEEFYAHRGRHPMRIHVIASARTPRRVAARGHLRDAIDGGAYSSFGLVTTYYSGQLLTMPAFAGAYRFHSTRYFTNKPPCGPKRGHGSVQPRFAFEGDARPRRREALGIDPIDAAAARTSVAANSSICERNAHHLQWVSSSASERRGGVPVAGRSGAPSSVAGAGWASPRARTSAGTNYPIYPNPMPQSAVQLKVDRSGVVTVFNRRRARSARGLRHLDGHPRRRRARAWISAPCAFCRPTPTSRPSTSARIRPAARS